MTAHYRIRMVTDDDLSTMHFSIPPYQLKPDPQPPAMVRAAIREDVQWNRPIFKAPPLQLHPETFDFSLFAQELRRVGLSQR
jgi:hypothetical protein